MNEETKEKVAKAAARLIQWSFLVGLVVGFSMGIFVGIEGVK